MYYINACSTISHQNSFRNNEWINEMEILTSESELIAPNYKDFIDRGSLRRMSKIIRMGLACAQDCIEQSNVENPEGIIVGTGLGCLTDTEKFLKHTLTIEGLIPPTSFIQSTHNTIAGQISLVLKNHNYNTTHTQNTLSFEHALADAMLCLDEDVSNVLIGAADESIPILNELVNEFRLNLRNKLTSGASFFMLSNTKTKKSKAQLVDSLTVGLNNSEAAKIINDFFERNNLSLSDIDLVLSNTNGTISDEEIRSHFGGVEVIPFEKYSGIYFTNSAFGMHLASEMLYLKKFETEEVKIKNVNRVLVYNNFKNKNIGLTLLQSLEA